MINGCSQIFQRMLNAFIVDENSRAGKNNVIGLRRYFSAHFRPEHNLVLQIFGSQR